jgi:hypothetical protein
MRDIRSRPKKDITMLTRKPYNAEYVKNVILNSFQDRLFPTS